MSSVQQVVTNQSNTTPEIKHFKNKNYKQKPKEIRRLQYILNLIKLGCV